MKFLVIDPGFSDKPNIEDGCACVVGEGAYQQAKITMAWFEHPRTFMPGRPLGARKQEWEKAKRRAENGDGFDQIVVEKPQYDKRSEKARIQDTIELAWQGASLAFAFSGRDGAPVIGYLPREWKGSEHKPLMHRRLWAVLDDEEREILGGMGTAILIQEACTKGGLDRWARPGGDYYSQAKRARFGGGRGGYIHNLLDAASLLKIHTGQLVRAG